MDRSLQQAGEELVAFFTPYAQLAAAREAQLGGPVPDCPTAGDMWTLVEAFRRLTALADPVEVHEVNTLMRAAADVSDKWVDPHADPIGLKVHGHLEALVDDLASLISVTMPDAKESLSQWNSLRKLGQMIRRAVHLRSQMRPKIWRYIYGRCQDWMIREAFRRHQS